MPVYSFGIESPIKFEISDKMAQNYNEAAVKFFKARQRFNQKFNRRWDPLNDPIALKWTKKQNKAWNQFAGVFNEVIKRDGPFHENDIMEDFLVRNASVVTAVVRSGWGRAISVVVVGGALYGYLRGL